MTVIWIVKAAAFAFMHVVQKAKRLKRRNERKRKERRVRKERRKISKMQRNAKMSLKTLVDLWNKHKK